MSRPFVTCDQWDVVVVPFPFTDRASAKRRPALVVTNAHFNDRGRTVLAMITSTVDEWPGDFQLRNLEEAGLRVSRKVRMKLFTLDNDLLVRRLGRIAETERYDLSEMWAVFGMRLECSSK